MIDLETGAVIGLHYGGRFTGRGKVGLGISLAALAEDPMWAAIGVLFED